MVKTLLINKNKFLAGLFFALCLFGGLLFWGEWGRQRVLTHIVSTPSVVAKSLTYKGVTGKNALELLKSHATIEQAQSGLVTSINGRKAEDSKHEYWAFYINGKMAEVGPLDYATKNSDTIEWKIATY